LSHAVLQLRSNFQRLSLLNYNKLLMPALLRQCRQHILTSAN